MMDKSSTKGTSPRSHPNINRPQIELTLAMQIGAISRAWRLVAFIVVCFAILGMVYLSVAKPLYEATAMIGPPSSTASPLSGETGAGLLGGSYRALAGLASGDSDGFNRYLQILHSARLAEVLERKYHAMDYAFPGRDPKTGTWQPSTGIVPTVARALKSLLGLPTSTLPTPSGFADFLDRQEHVEAVADSTILGPKNNIKTISIDADSRESAIEFLTVILTEADNLCREDALVNINRRISHLQQVISQTSEVSVRDYLNAVLVSEEQSAIIAQSNTYYSVDLIDTPNADAKPIWPHGGLIMLASVFAGLVVSFFVVFLILQRRIGDASSGDEDPLARPFPDPFWGPIEWLQQTYRRLVSGGRTTQFRSSES